MANLTNTGNFYRNGGNRYFHIESANESMVIYQEYTYAGASGRILKMPRATWDQLLKHKNFVQIHFFKSIKTGRWMERRDWGAEAAIGANRYLVKQTYPSK